MKFFIDDVSYSHSKEIKDEIVKAGGEIATESSSHIVVSDKSTFDKDVVTFVWVKTCIAKGKL